MKYKLFVLAINPSTADNATKFRRRNAPCYRSCDHWCLENYLGIDLPFSLCVSGSRDLHERKPFISHFGRFSKKYNLRTEESFVEQDCQVRARQLP